MHRFFESIIHPALTILQPRVIVEIGIDEGLNTQKLLRYCQEDDVILHAIDPDPHCDIETLHTAYEGRCIFHKDLSLHALQSITTYDAVLIDGDHNWYTVYHELLLTEKKAREQGNFPLIFLHDIGWPYGRRDLYYNPDTIPAGYRQPYEKKGVVPGKGQLADGHGWNPHLSNAIYEHYVRNGVLTAVEDFMTQSTEKLHLTSIPGFHGLGILASPTLLSQNSNLQEFLASLHLSTPLAQHIEALEKVELEHIAYARQHLCPPDDERNKLQQTKRELVRMCESRDRLRAELTAKTDIVYHMTQTRSWRWTAPLRRGGHLLRRPSLSPAYMTLHLLRWMWTTLGSPFPQVARHIRHDILARYFPPRSPNSPSTTLSSSPLVFSQEIPHHASSLDLRTAVLVVCHHRASLLPKTIESLLAQTEKASEILILDDDSTDETKHTALSYAGKGVEYLRGTWHNVLAAWNAGLQSTESSLLIFLRAGEHLPPTYISCCQTALREHTDAAIVSPHASITPFPFDPVYFEQENTLPDRSLVRRSALLDVGGWSHGLERDAVWITWRRILANGWKVVKVPGVADMHHASTTLSMTPPPIDATLCLSLSGREWMWPLTQDFLEKQTYPHARTHLVVIDTSQSSAFGGAVQSWLHRSDYGKYTYLPLSVGLKGLADLPRKVVSREVASACACIYQTFAPLCSTPWVFFLEDDVLPPSTVYPRLLAHFSHRTASVSALCLQRHGPHPIAWEWDHAHFPTDAPLQRGVTPVGGNGFCCVVVRGEHIRNGQFHAGPGPLCHDHNFYHTIVCESGLQALLDWSCFCRHYVSPGEWRSSLSPSASLANMPAGVV